MLGAADTTVYRALAEVAPFGGVGQRGQGEADQTDQEVLGRGGDKSWNRMKVTTRATQWPSVTYGRSPPTTVAGREGRVP